MTERTGTSPAAGTHLCPGTVGAHYPGPDVAADKLACLAHWRRVSEPTQRAVYAAWDDGRGSGSKAHRDAIAAAIAEMNRPRGQ